MIVFIYTKLFIFFTVRDSNQLLGIKVLDRSVVKFVTISALALSQLVSAEELKTFQPFEISVNQPAPSTQSVNTYNSTPTNTFFHQDIHVDSSGFDFLLPQDKGYHLSTNKDGLFGDELVVGMKFADWLTLRFNVIENDDSIDLFSTNQFNRSQFGQSDSDLAGYQFGVSSVLNISSNWRFGIDVGMGKVGGDLVGLYQDQVETTRLGFGVRNQKFGATFQSDFMNMSSDNQLEQSTMDLQVDWHFTKDGTISFGARRNVRDNNTATSLDQLTGTVPYIKFKHNL